MDFGDAACPDELQASLKVVLMAIAGMNLVEVLVPTLLPLVRKFFQRTKPQKQLKRMQSKITGQKRGGSLNSIRSNSSDPDRSSLTIGNLAGLLQSMLDKEIHSTVDVSGTDADYVEILVLFAHVLLFSVVFPFAPLIVLVLLVVEMRVDGHKLFYTFRRPLPRSAETIGAWTNIFQCITWLSVLTNSMMVIWTLGVVDAPIFLPDASPLGKWFICVCGVLILAGFKTVVILLVPDMPNRLQILLDHHQYVCQQLNITDKTLIARSRDVNELDTSIYNAT
jgi:hypothetical protein